MPFKMFSGALKQKVMVCYKYLLLEKKPLFTTTSWKRRERARNGTSLLAETEEVLRASISMECYAESLFRMKGPLCIACHGEKLSSKPGIHIFSVIIFDYIQSQTMWTFVRWCPFVTSQCSTPYLAVKQLQLLLLVSSTSSILARPSSKWFPPVWATQRVTERKDFHVSWRGIAGGYTLDQKNYFFNRYPSTL